MSLISNVIVKFAEESELIQIKSFLYGNRDIFGFVPNSALYESYQKQNIFIALDLVKEKIAGFLRFNYRKDFIAVIYEIYIAEEFRHKGIGKMLINRLFFNDGKQVAIIAKCPTDLPANGFYDSCGFKLLETRTGKKRLLNVWRLDI